MLYTLNLRDSLSTMLMNILADRLSTSVLLVAFMIDSVTKYVSTVSLLTTKLKLKHVSIVPTSNVTEALDAILMVEFPGLESV